MIDDIIATIYDPDPLNDEFITFRGISETDIEDLFAICKKTKKLIKIDFIQEERCINA